MLPGFRFLFATVVLAVSVLVFGLGAAALLRAAHEEFASLPSWRLAQQPLCLVQVDGELLPGVEWHGRKVVSGQPTRPSLT